MSGLVLIEWKNVPRSGTKKYRAPRMKINQANGLPTPRRAVAGRRVLVK
jgi:hypothetical protein